MADSNFFTSANAHTSGSLWTVLVTPSFPDQIFEAAHFLSRPTPTPLTSTKASAAAPTGVAPSEWAVGLKERATEAVGGGKPEGEGEEEEEEVEKDKVESEEVKEKKRVVVQEVWGKVGKAGFGRCDDREMDAMTNLLLSLQMGSFPATHPEFRKLLEGLVEAIAATESKVSSYGRCNALATIFNALPTPESGDAEPLQLTILLRLAALASSNPDDLPLLLPSLLRLPTYLSQWSLLSSSSPIITVIQTLTKGKKPEEAFKVGTEYCKLAGEQAGSEVAGLVVEMGLKLAEFYDWEALESLPAVSKYLSSTPEVAAVLTALRNGSLSDVQSKLGSAKNLDDATKEQVERKARLLALAELCGDRVGGEVAYEEVRECLGLETKVEDDDGMQVEEWVIHAIKAHLISARLHQPTHKIHITTSTSRTFTHQHWTVLLEKLKAWSSSVDGILNVVDKSLPSAGGGEKSGNGEEETAGKGVVASA